MKAQDHDPVLDYVLIEKAIAYLDQNSARQPILADVAAHVGLSEFHLQRLFSRWAGISPKRFLQAATIQHAKGLLDHSASVLETAHEVGLSGPGRLHDLFVHGEAMTPGEYKKAGEGLLLCYGIHPTRFGWVLIGLSERGICALRFTRDRDGIAEFEELRSEWAGAEWNLDQNATGLVVEQIFGAGGPSGPLHLHVRGTNFQLKVWNALLQIPSGGATTYGDLACEIGSPKAARAVGSAVGRNPIGYLIPCHRVLRRSGAIDQYRWGGQRKRTILAWESLANQKHPADLSSAAG